MSSMTDSRFVREKWLVFARVAWYVCALLSAVVLLGALPVYYSHLVQPISRDPHGLGQFNASFRVVFELGDLCTSVMSFLLAVLLFWRKPRDRVALFVSFFLLVTAVTGLRVLDNVLTAYFGAPSTYELWGNLQTPLWMLLFCIFPDGRFVPRWLRWILAASVATTLVVFTEGDLRTIILVVVFGLFLLVGYAQVYRYRHVSNYEERQQTKWWLYGVFVSFLLAFIASLIFRLPSPPLLNVMPIFLTIAILRSHLWDIDIIIRKTLTYTIVVAVWVLVYFVGVILLQQLFANVTGQRSEIITVLSTLAIAALFVPLRNRVQGFIDRRFYRKRYDAQQVLNDFANTVRDETDLETLTGRLMQVVDETMQPKSVSVWLMNERNKS